MPKPNYDFLESNEPILLQLAEAFVPDPNTTFINLRQPLEAFAKDSASRNTLMQCTNAFCRF